MRVRCLLDYEDKISGTKILNGEVLNCYGMEIRYKDEWVCDVDSTIGKFYFEVIE